jgi:hypothetical protein
LNIDWPLQGLSPQVSGKDLVGVALADAVTF